MAGHELTIITGGLVLTPSFTAEHADVVIEGDTIHAIEPPGSGVKNAIPGAHVVDASGRALMPGLVNAHVHGHGTLAKGLVGDRWPLELYLNALPGIGANRNLEDKYLNGLIGAVEMIRKGCTSCYDLFFEFPRPSSEGIFALGNAYRDAGIRAVIAPMLADKTFYQAYPELFACMPDALRAEALAIQITPYEASVESVRAAFRAWPFDRDLIRPGIAPTIPLHCSDDFLISCRDLAKEFDLPMQTHLAESKAQAVTGLARYGKTLTAHLDGLGLLGPQFSAAHAIWLDDEDMKRLADNGSSVIHAPGSNLRFGSGMAKIRRLMDHGVNVGMATDASDMLNMFELLRLGASLSRVMTPTFERWLGVEDVLGMATVGGAHAMGFNNTLGRIAPGYKADIVLLNLDHINYVPLNDLAKQIVYTENGAAVESVMINGRLVMDHGRITTIDEAKLRRDAKAAAERLFSANAPMRVLSERLQPIIGQFCRGFSCQPYHVNRLACEPGIDE